MSEPTLNPNQLWIVDTLLGVGSAVGTAAGASDVKLADVFVDMLAQSPDIPTGITDLYQQYMNPDTWVGKVVKVVAEGAGIIPVVVNAARIAAEPGFQQLRKVMPHTLLDPGTLTTVRQWSDAWQDDYHKYMQLHGFTDERSDLLYFAARPRPGLGEILGAFVKRHGRSFTTGAESTGYAWADEWLNIYTGATLQIPSVAEAVTLLRRGYISRDEYTWWLSRNNYERDAVQYAEAMLEGVMSPSEIMRAGFRNAQGGDWHTAELKRVQFDPHYNTMLETLTWEYPNASEYAQYLRRTGHDGDLPPGDFARLFWPPERLPYLAEMSWTIPGPGDVARYEHHQGRALDEYRGKLSKVGLHPDYHALVDDLSLGRPSPAEWFAYAHRMQAVGDVGPVAMTRLGYNPEYWGVWETLSHPLPGVADLVMMAVREVFSPEIAEAFGQFSEIPDAFLQHAGRIGLSEEWARNYWAAHWTLPSVMQGFDMLHRDVITPDDLSRLFVALDVMPFWRDKLTDISYRLLTRVDVRRMYAEGVLTYAETQDAYSKLGYSPLNAERMANFTVAYVRRQQVGFTRSQVLSAYRDRVLTVEEARGMLELLGIAGEDADFALSMEDWELERDEQNARIKIVETEFSKGLLSFEDAGIRLDGLGVPDRQKTLLLDRWQASAAAKTRTFTKAEIMGYLVSGAMSYTVAAGELSNLGYADELVGVMLSDAAMNAVAVRGKRPHLSMSDMVEMLASDILDMQAFTNLLTNYGWRNPELSMLICHIAAAAKMDLPEGMEPCNPESVSRMLLTS